MNPLTAQLASQHIRDMQRVAARARLARHAHILRRQRHTRGAR